MSGEKNAMHEKVGRRDKCPKKKGELRAKSEGSWRNKAKKCGKIEQRNKGEGIIRPPCHPPIKKNGNAFRIFIIHLPS